jgi:hypothetical protein
MSRFILTDEQAQQWAFAMLISLDRKYTALPGTLETHTSAVAEVKAALLSLAARYEEADTGLSFREWLAGGAA